MAKEVYQNKYNKKRATILLKGFVPSLLAILIPKKKNRIIFNSTRNEFFNFNTKYLFEYMIEHYPNLDIKYVINDKNKRDKLNKEFGRDKNYFIETETISGMWYALRAYSWIANSFETPVGGILLKFNRFVYLLGHGALFRSYVFREKKLSIVKKIYYYLIKNNFSYYLITSDQLVDEATKTFKCNKEQIIVLGEPASDSIWRPNEHIMKRIFGQDILKNKNILYAPTWRQDGSLKLFPFDDMSMDEMIEFLEENGINIFLRLHPSYEEDLSFYTTKSKRIKIIDTSKVEDINEVIGLFDLVITDYSSVHIGYMLTKKPLLFLPYDLEKYEKRMGFVLPYHEATPGPKPTSLVAFMNEIERLLKDKSYFAKEREEAIRLFNKYSKDNCKMNAEFIITELNL